MGMERGLTGLKMGIWTDLMEMGWGMGMDANFMG